MALIHNIKQFDSVINSAELATLTLPVGTVVKIEDRGNCEFIAEAADGTADGSAIIAGPAGLHYKLLPTNGSYNVLGAGAKGDGFHDDGIPVNSLVQLSYRTFISDIVFPAVSAGASYVLRTPVDIIFSSASITAPSITLRGVGSVNGLSAETRISHMLGNYGIRQRNIGVSYRDFKATVFAGAPVDIVSTGANSVTLARNPFEVNDGNPVTWSSAVTAGDGTSYASGYVQFATNAGTFYGSTFTSNSDGTYTIGNVRHVSSATTDLTTSTRIVRFSSRAHFEPSDGAKYPAPASNTTGCFIWADTLENMHMDHIWFLQCLRCINHDLGAGSGADAGIGNIGTFSNIIVDGAFSFMANTDLSTSSAQSLNGGHFSNVQFYSVRAPFVGRRIQNVNIASLQLFSSDGLFFARDVSHVAIPGSILGWDGTTGFAKNILVCENVEDANFSACVFGRHRYDTPMMTFNSCAGLSLVGSTLGTVSEGGSNGGWIYVTGAQASVVGLDIAVSVAHLTGSGRDSISMFFEDTSSTSHNFSRNSFRSKVYTQVARSLRHYSSASGDYGWFYSAGTQNGGYSFSFTENVNSWTPSLTRKAIKLSGTLTSTVVKTLPDVNALPEQAQDWVIDTRTVVMGSYLLTVSGFNLSRGIHVFKWTGEWTLVSSQA